MLYKPPNISHPQLSLIHRPAAGLHQTGLQPPYYAVPPCTTLYKHTSAAPHCTTDTVSDFTMPPKRKAAVVDGNSPDVPQTPTKRRKPTAATNAEAIEEMGSKLEGVDKQLANIANMLSVLSSQQTQPSAGTPVPTSTVMGGCAPGSADVQTPAAPPRANRTTNQQVIDPGQLLPTPGATVDLTLTGQHDHAPLPTTTQPPLQQPAGRSRHVTTGQLPQPAQPYGWAGVPGISTGQQPTAHASLGFAPNQPPTRPWIMPTSIHETDSDVSLTRRVAEALHAAVDPLAAHTGKHPHHAHDFVTRGNKRSKTGLGELTLSEYIWGFIQLIKSKEASDHSIPYMNNHLEALAEDAKTYDWAGVRA